MLQTAGTSDTFPYFNKFTNNYDAITMTFSDTAGAGYRATAPDLLLFPSGISVAINSHDTFTYNGATYKLYVTNNKRDFCMYVLGYNNNYYPAFRMD